MFQRLIRMTFFFLILSILSVMLVGCLPNGPSQVTMEDLDTAEATWLASPSMNYMMTVEVDRPDDKRRNMIVVAEGEIVEGIVSYWDPATRKWQDALSLNEEQAFPFTVPGLFEMVRGSLEDSGREDIRVEMDGEPPFPQKIIFGPVIVDGEPFSMTEATITVKHFQEN
jgi:hypothetical protein